MVLALATAVRVVDRVHDGTADGRAHVHVTLTAGLADDDVGVIGIADLMFRTNDVIAVTYKNLECLAVAALCYFVLTFVSGRAVSLAERKLSHGK